jgi:16S rRNA (cytosine1407-C5)-methyltransferase
MAKKRKPTPGNKQIALDNALDKMQPLLSVEAYQALMVELALPLMPAIRLNPLKVNDSILLEWQQAFGWKTRSIPYCEHGYWVDAAEAPISKTLAFHFGQYYIQDASSMLPVSLFDFPDNALVLDMAASPGGKTTHLLSRMMDRGFVLANDASRSRLTALQLVLQNWGGLNVGVTSFNGESFGQWYPNMFDAVLLDAPCSMQNLRNTESHPMREITESERQNLSGRQQRLLESALQAVRPGGEVVYATCTLSPEEDEMVLQQIKGQFGSALEIVQMDARLPQPAPGLAAYAGQVFDEDIRHALRIWPHLFHTSGFFCAKLRKLEPTNHMSQLAAPSRNMKSLGWQQLSGAALVKLSAELQEVYGMNLLAWQDSQDVVLYQYNQKIFAFPKRYFSMFDGLPVQMLGMLMGELLPGGFSPEHDFITRFFDSFTQGKILLPDELLAAWLRGEDIRDLVLDEGMNGKILLTCDSLGRYLGLGKMTRERYRNLLPKRVYL